MIEELLSGLKTLFSVETDTDLAAALGLDRSTIAQWRRRGQMPEKYRAVGGEAAALEAEKGRLVDASRRVVRSLVYRDPAYHLWTAAALAALPAEAYELRPGESANERGKRLEVGIAELFQRCLAFSQESLGKVRPESEADYLELVEALRAEVSQ